MVRGAKGKPKTLAIFNRYKDTFKDFINSLNIESPIMPKPVGKGPRNIMFYLKGPPTKSKLDENLLDGSLQQQWYCKVAPIARNSIEQQRHNNQLPGIKKYGEVRRKKNKRGIERHWENRIEPVVGKDSFSGASVYYRIIEG